MKRQLMTIAAMGSLLAGLTFAQAQAPVQTNPGQPNRNQAHSMRKPGEKRGEHQRMMFQKLNLTAAQKERAKAIFGQAREASKPTRELLKTNHEAMTAAVKADNKPRIAQLSAERGALMGKLATVRNESMAKFYRELTPQQRETFKADGFGAQRANRAGSSFNRGPRG
jgi:Spy/CpxP family protein refolding chaperone